MNWNKSPLAFGDVRDAFERALNAERGIKITCASHGEAIILRSRFNYYRKLDRADNRNTYPEDHPLHGSSAYDRLVLRVPPKGAPDDTAVFIEPRKVEDLAIEDL